MARDVLRIGIMGFGQLGRRLYRLAAQSHDLEIAAVADIAKAEVLHYLLVNDAGVQCQLEGNYLVNQRFRTRLLNSSSAAEPPWEIFDVDLVIDASGAFRDSQTLKGHLDNGAPRVIMASLPDSALDRLIVAGINEADACSTDQLLSAGSATTSALALSLKVLDRAFGVDTASMTSVHAITSDQPAQDHAGGDYRRSRSAADNIIPNSNASPRWVETLLPGFAGALSGQALNVPVQRGSMLDLSTVMRSAEVTVEDVNTAFKEAARNQAALLGVAEDPIVSSDIIGDSHAGIFDLRATMKCGRRMVKSLIWYDELSHAERILDVARLYRKLDGGKAEPGRAEP